MAQTLIFCCHRSRRNSIWVSFNGVIKLLHSDLWFESICKIISCEIWTDSEWFIFQKIACLIRLWCFCLSLWSALSCIVFPHCSYLLFMLFCVSHLYNTQHYKLHSVIINNLHFNHYRTYKYKNNSSQSVTLVITCNSLQTVAPEAKLYWYGSGSVAEKRVMQEYQWGPTSNVVWGNTVSSPSGVRGRAPGRSTIFLYFEVFGWLIMLCWWDWKSHRWWLKFETRTRVSCHSIQSNSSVCFL